MGQVTEQTCSHSFTIILFLSGFDILEDVSVAIFTIEYLARLYACVEHTDPRTGQRPFAVVGCKDKEPGGNDTKCIFWGRVLYAFTDFYAVLDLAVGRLFRVNYFGSACALGFTSVLTQAILPFYIDLALVSVDLVFCCLFSLFMSEFLANRRYQRHF